MKTVFKREIALNLKGFLIWSLSVGLMGLFCILVYRSMEGEMSEMAEAFSHMGAFSEAFGMSTLSIATMKGFFATEVGVVHGLGGAMFAAITAICILSKEEEGHSGEFLLSLPVARRGVVAAKGLCVAVMLAVFTVICGLLYAMGFAILGESVPAGEFLKFMAMQLLMNFEVAAICFMISSRSGKNKTGLGIALAMIFYFYDVIGRVVPDMKDYLFVGPFSYANASEIFSGKATDIKALAFAIPVIVAASGLAFFFYDRRDLAA